ncbi:MAG TPA: hypothetical protein VFB99_12865 [Vicinamibacterales bacterium]|nr:hypothetical protein [Vicinamibacterales bacterium]
MAKENNEALAMRLAELEADLARARQESAAKDAIIARKEQDLQAASALLEQEKPLVEIHGTGKIIALEGCTFTDAAGEGKEGMSATDRLVVRREARKGDVITPCKADLARLHSVGAVALT